MMQKQLASKDRRIWIVIALCSLSLCYRTGRAQQGFISIDCGATTSYIDTKGLTWIPDELLTTIIGVGDSSTVTPPTDANAPDQFSTIRYFPGNQTKYCYVFNNFNNQDHGIVAGSAYLVRASFWVGTALPYETQVQNIVSFKLLMNADEWDDVVITLPQTEAIVKEMYVIAMKDTIDVCVAGKVIGMDIPFISSLVLRPLYFDMSSVRLMIDKVGNRPLFYMHRINYGAPSNDTVISYEQDGLGDSYDRVWQPDTRAPIISTSSTVATGSPDYAPAKVIQDAYQSDDSINLTFSLPPNHFYHYTLYFSELSANVTLPGQRVFQEQVFNGTKSLFAEETTDIFKFKHNTRFIMYELYAGIPVYVGIEGFISFIFTKQHDSIYGPLICGLEILQVSDHDMPLGIDDDEDATLINVTSPFSSLNSWSGDPCLPYAYNWLTCTKDMRPFISTISLSNKSLVGEIPTGLNNFKALVELSLDNNKLFGPIPNLGSLQDLQVLDLHGNNLSGNIPTFLGELPNLTTLNLDYNNFSGQIPSTLLAKASSNKLKFSIAGNPYICPANSTEHYCKASPPPSSNNNGTTTGEEAKKSNGALVAGASVGAIAALVVVGILVFCIVKHKKKTVDGVNEARNHPQESNSNILGRPNQANQFSFESIKTMTRNFETILGQGGFGPVYHGVLQNGENVAVKVLAKDSRQGEDEFLNEGKLLSRVHHKNLVNLVGYCTETQLVLVYEFMANGSLFEALKGKGARLVTWRDRLRIAMDAADGLDYLHRGCNPSIIHRDVKSSNILLNEKLEGKISDFGISKSKQHNTNTMAGGSQMFTAVQGTFGYLDPA
eukprot:c25365_g2_i6 orf=50-2548(+)